MTLNDNIKYCEKPAESIWDDIVVQKEEKKMMKCISHFSSRCKGQFMTTKEFRICEYCKNSLKGGGHL